MSCQPIHLRVPRLDSSRHAVFAGWLVDDGQQVMQGELVAELLINGVLIQLPAPANGVISQQPLQVGQRVQVDQLLAQCHPDVG